MSISTLHKGDDDDDDDDNNNNNNNNNLLQLGRYPVAVVILHVYKTWIWLLTNNNYAQDNLKLATKHTREIRIQHVQKVKTPK